MLIYPRSLIYPLSHVTKTDFLNNKKKEQNAIKNKEVTLGTKAVSSSSLDQGCYV